MWTDKEGKKVSKEEFMQRWKAGIEKVTAMQKVKFQILSSIIILLGISIGIVTAIISRVWWLLIVLLGAMGLNIISLIGILQQYIAYDKIEKMTKGDDMKGGEDGF